MRHRLASVGLNIVEANTPVWGFLRLEIYKNGKLIRVEAGKNVVTNGGKNLWVGRLFDGTLSKGVAYMEVGDGGAADGTPFVPIAFAGTDTNLRTTVGLTAVIDPSPVQDTGAKTITFVAVLASALANPSNFHYTPRVINEIALKTASPDNVTVALRAFRSIPFDPNDSMEVRASWTLGQS